MEPPAVSLKRFSMQLSATQSLASSKTAFLFWKNLGLSSDFIAAHTLNFMNQFLLGVIRLFHTSKINSVSARYSSRSEIVGSLTLAEIVLIRSLRYLLSLIFHSEQVVVDVRY